MKSVHLFCLLFYILMASCATTSNSQPHNVCSSEDESFQTTYYSNPKHFSENKRSFIHGMDSDYVFRRKNEVIFMSVLDGLEYFTEKDGHEFASAIGDKCNLDEVEWEYIPRFILKPNLDLEDSDDWSPETPDVETICDGQNRPLIEYFYGVDDKGKRILERTKIYRYGNHPERVLETASFDTKDSALIRSVYTYNNNGDVLSEKSILNLFNNYYDSLFEHQYTNNHLVKGFTRRDGFVQNRKIRYVVDFEVDYTYQNDRVFSYPELIKARTLFDKSPHAWESSPRPKPPEDLPLYNPDNPPPYAELIENFSEYQLDPAYAELEPEDYPGYECNPPMEHPDYAHPSRQFWMSPTEVTQGEFASRMGFNPSFFSACGDNCPVENVTWYQALAYANKASQDEGLEPCYVLKDCTELSKSCADVSFRGLDCRGYRLPTDEEWRYMAKKNGNYGDGDIRSPAYADRVELSAIEAVHGTAWQRMQEIAWGYENSSVEYENCRPIRRTYSGFFIRPKPPHAKQEIALDGFGYYPDCIGPHPVAQKQPDANGIYDFYGNVGEWVWDWYGHSRRSGDSLGPEIGICKIFRGGTSHDKIDDSDQPFYRPGCYLPERGGSVVGFRLVRTIDGYIAHDQNLP